ncbi:hypothetical protein NP233_g9334 [Leucocoprinus birnbaumii]|uniref:Transmembrane protein n=1 Tax=Leucocoprinus birnbaumii TaxID=56174 RepID=A0AAD5VP60_9AGAR|nr:hypothetical protein NP233_g9334 [Leucocoprinus birnbaumii]
MAINLFSNDSPIAPGLDRLTESETTARAGPDGGSAKQALPPHPRSAECAAHHPRASLRIGSSTPYIGAVDVSNNLSTATTISPSPTLCQTLQADTQGRLRLILGKLCEAVAFSPVFISTILSLGVPYWYYRWYRLRNPSKPLSSAEQEKLVGGTQAHDSEKWNQIVRRLSLQWKAIFAISVGALPAVFPMLAIYTDPKCSWASLLAALSLFSGLASMIFAKTFLFFSDLFQEEGMRTKWHCVSLTWLSPQSQAFWLFISLPTIWLSSQIATLTATIVLAVLEQVAVAPSENACLESRLFQFRVMILSVMSMAATHSAFFIYFVNSHARSSAIIIQ